MSIRAKCAILLIAFEATLAVSIILTVRFTRVYFEDVAESLSVSPALLEDIGRLHAHVREEQAILSAVAAGRADVGDSPLQSDVVTTETKALASQLQGRVSDEELERLRVSGEERKAAVDRMSASLAAEGAASFDSDAHRAFGAELERLKASISSSMHVSANAVVGAQNKVAIILSVNMFVGAALGLLGLYVVRRWALLPLLKLQHATDEFGKGNLEHRADVHSNDELGQLAAALNRMSSDLARAERSMIQRERLAAMVEMASYVAHNIRNPLAGIQSSAELTRQEAEPNSAIAEHQASIIAAIAKFQRWLRQIEYTCGPMEIRAEPTDLSELVAGVVSVFRPIIDRTMTIIRQSAMTGVEAVNLDARQFEQALTAVLGNAVEAVGDRGVIEIGVEAGEDGGGWTLYVADDGPGIPVEAREHVFEPTFSTKRHGHGLGLAMAKRVVHLHGGDLMCCCPPEGGTVFRFVMPAEPGERRVDE